MNTYLTKALFLQLAEKHNSRSQTPNHWNANRWIYHEKAVEALRRINPISVLEIGPMGIKLMTESDTMDFDVGASWLVEQPTYLHNAKVLPWPIGDLQYDCLVALRVFHHLAPSQKECFLEAKRVAKNIIIVVPDSYQETHIGSKAIKLNDFIEWNDGVKPSEYIRTGHGDLYCWYARATDI